MSQIELSEDKLEIILQKMYKTRGWDFRRYRRSSLKRCVERRISVSNLPPAEYAELLDDHPLEYDHLFNHLTIKVSEFFRDKEVFQQISRKVIPATLERIDSSKGRSLRVWSCGCARGEEAYSIAILLYLAIHDDLELPEFLSKSDMRFNLFDDLAIKILATDIDEKAVDIARSGIYHEYSLKNTDPDIADSFMRPAESDNHYQVIPHIRNMVTFGVHDIVSNIHLSHMDLLICRNLLIYFEKDLQEKVFEKFWLALNKDGFLILGRSEVVPPKYRDSFREISKREKIYQKI